MHISAEQKRVEPLFAKTLAIAALTMAASDVVLYLLLVLIARTVGEDDALAFASWSFPVVPVVLATVVSWSMLRRRQALSTRHRRLVIAGPALAYVASLAVYGESVIEAFPVLAILANIESAALLLIAAGVMWGVARSQRTGPGRRPAPPDDASDSNSH